MWAVMGKFGFTPGWCAVRPDLLDVRTKGGGEDVGASEVSARNEAGNLGLCSAVAGLSRSVLQCSDRVVAACGLAQSEAGGVGGACVGRQHRRKRTGSTYSPGSNTAP